MAGLIAIVGRPNVGKSALFNRIVGRRIAIVHDQPGVTRDRISAEAEWKGRRFTLVDTGGIGLLRGEKTQDVIVGAAIAQVDLAIEAAEVILFVVDGQEGLVPLDQEVGRRLRASGKPVVVVVNKVDHAGVESSESDFARLGFDRVFTVSAIHGRGIQTLVDAAVAFLPAPAVVVPALPEDAETAEEEEDEAAKKPVAKGPKVFNLAIVGRPNVGKSSIINALTKSTRVIVSPIPGTTRDAVDVPFVVQGEGGPEHYMLVDTAGIRKPRRVGDSIEFFSVKRAEEAISRCDIAVLVMDAAIGISEQDKKIGDRIVEERKACILVVNKWDLVKEEIEQARREEIEERNSKERRGRGKPMTTLGEFGQWVQENLFFLAYAPVIFTSAKEDFQLDRLLEAVRYVAAQLQQKIPTSLLNKTLHQAIERRQPVSSAGHRLKFYYATQLKESPPTFLLFVNKKDLLSDTYKKYLADQMRTAFGYEGCPVVLIPRDRPKTIEPKKKHRKPSHPKPEERHRRPKS